MWDYSKARYKKRLPPLTGRDEDDMRQHAYVIQPEDAWESMKLFDQYKVKAEYELFGLYGIKMLRQLINLGKLEGPHWVSILFGGNGLMPSVTSMIEASQLLPTNTVFNIIGIGAPQIPMITAGLVLGHNVRVGMEDNVFYAKGRLAKSNAEMVERAVRIAKEIGRTVATPAQAREMMGLGAPRQYN
jgi:3-keto-5-aminohexanoate cleavage enzyme